MLRSCGCFFHIQVWYLPWTARDEVSLVFFVFVITFYVDKNDKFEISLPQKVAIVKQKRHFEALCKLEVIHITLESESIKAAYPLYISPF